MKKKDFILISAVIQGRMERERDIARQGNKTEGQQIAIKILAQYMADELKHTNPRFDRERFLKACYVDEIVFDRQIKHKHNREDCEMSDCVVCGLTVHRCELDENLQCNNCK